MKENKIEISYKVFDDINELTKEDAWLLNEAREVTKQAYAPYSNFYVGAAAKLVNGEIVAGTNQENASYPVGFVQKEYCLHLPLLYILKLQLKQWPSVIIVEMGTAINLLLHVACAGNHCRNMRYV